MVVATATGALDLWTLLVSNTFGGFWITVIALMLVIFIIMAVLGRMSIYSVTWYEVMFLLTMSLGSGYVIINVLVLTTLLVAFYFSITNYIMSNR